MAEQAIETAVNGGLAVADGSAVSGASLPWRALKLIVKTPKLLALALAPALVGVSSWMTGFVTFVAYGDDLLAKWIGKPETLSMLGKFAFYAGWAGLVLAAPVAMGFVASRVLAAPVLDKLGEKTLEVLGRPVKESKFSDYPGILALATTRFVFYVAVSAGLFVANLVPGAVVLVGPAGLAWSALWIFTDTLQPALDAVGKKGVWPALTLFRKSPAKASGFTALAAALSFVPFLGALVTPLLVVAGAMFVAETEESK